MRARGDGPALRCANSEVYHDYICDQPAPKTAKVGKKGGLTTREQETNQPGVLETLHHLIEADIETCRPHLLSRRSPFDINTKGVTKERLSAIETDTAEEED